MHAHATFEGRPKSFPLLIANGITGIRDPWGSIEIADSAGAAEPLAAAIYLQTTGMSVAVEGIRAMILQAVAAFVVFLRFSRGSYKATLWLSTYFTVEYSQIASPATQMKQSLR